MPFRPPGPTGPPGSGISSKGDWSSATAYNIGDVVGYIADGYITFIAVAPSTNVTPSQGSAEWEGLTPIISVRDEGALLTRRKELDFQGAGVTVTDDSGNARTVITIPGGGGGGGITAISGATDQDSATKQAGGQKIRTNKSLWWQASGGKVRYDAPNGFVNVMDPYYGTCKRDGIGGIANSGPNTLAIRNACIDAASLYNGGTGNSGGGGGKVFFPAGTYVINDPILKQTNYLVEQTWMGEGQLSSIIKLDTEANLANPLVAGVGGIVDLHQPQGGQVARFYPQNILFRTSWTFGAAANFYSVQFPLVSLGSGDLANMRDFFLWYAYGNGIELVRSRNANQPQGSVPNQLFPNGTKPSACDRWSISGIHANLCRGHGIYLANGGAFGTTINGVEVSNNLGAGLFLDGTGSNLGNMIVDGLQCEECGDYAVYLKSMQNVVLRGVYAFQCPIYLDDDTTECIVEGNQPYDQLSETDQVEYFAYGGQVVDNGFNNVIGPNGGQGYPAPGIRDGKTIQQLMPSGAVSDADMKQRLITGWTTVGATVTKGYTGSEYRRSIPQVGGGSMLSMLQSVVATPGGGNATFPVAGNECYFVEVIWAPGSASIPGLRVRVLNDADSSVIHSVPTQTIQGSRPPNGDEVRPQMIRFICKIPSGVTTARLEVFAAQTGGGAQPMYLFSATPVKLGLLNANMQGWTAGVLDGWSNDLTGGTVSQETATVDTSRGYTNAARLHVNAASTVSIIQTVAPMDARKFYLVRARYFIPTGQADTASSMRRRTKARWGGFTGGGNFQQNGIRGRKVGVWDDIMFIVKPGGTALNSATRDRISFGLGSGTLAYDVILQELYAMPLKDDNAPRSWVSQEITLSANSPSVMIGVPTIASIIRSITLVYTEATSSNAGVAVNIGTAATAAYFGTLTSAVSQAQDTVVDVPLSRTDMRAGVPLRLSSPGNKVGLGKVAVIVEFE